MCTKSNEPNGENWTNIPEDMQELIAQNKIVLCPECNEYNAVQWMDVNMNRGMRLKPEDGLSDGGELYDDFDLMIDWPDTYQMLGFGKGAWECGCCGSIIDEKPIKHYGKNPRPTIPLNYSLMSK